ncbi:hypothetical protein K3495_g5906 [Podosphaera aphanis]|nr:hypothetical protein K3495_g5906 [Podosphaera aphanis]
MPTPAPPKYSHSSASPPGPLASNHDWQSIVPDTSLLPPPPCIGNQRSLTNNALEQEALQGERWCRQNPIANPRMLSDFARLALRKDEVGLTKPHTYKGSLDCPRPGIWAGKSKANCPDSCILSTIPLYSVQAHSPLQTKKSKTIYFEVHILSQDHDAGLALGFTALPYPIFRLPGWHRGSLAVHGDDGSKFINDSWGGKSFTRPFNMGETLGIGLELVPQDQTASSVDNGIQSTTYKPPIDVTVFLTRNGQIDGSWDLHEERDALEDLPVTGLEGYHDLYPAVGVFGRAKFEIVFRREKFTYQPQGHSLMQL